MTRFLSASSHSLFPALSICFILLFCSERSVAQETDEGFRDIFDGSSLDGWTGDSEFWRIEDGTIVGETTAEKPLDHNQFLRWAAELGDFELRLKYRISGTFSANSGIQFRSQLVNDEGKLAGYQAFVCGYFSSF